MLGKSRFVNSGPDHGPQCPVPPSWVCRATGCPVHQTVPTVKWGPQGHCYWLTRHCKDSRDTGAKAPGETRVVQMQTMETQHGPPRTRGMPQECRSVEMPVPYQLLFPRPLWVEAPAPARAGPRGVGVDTAAAKEPGLRLHAESGCGFASLASPSLSPRKQPGALVSHSAVTGLSRSGV